MNWTGTEVVVQTNLIWHKLQFRLVFTIRGVTGVCGCVATECPGMCGCDFSRPNSLHKLYVTEFALGKSSIVPSGEPREPLPHFSQQCVYCFALFLTLSHNQSISVSISCSLCPFPHTCVQIKSSKYKMNSWWYKII